MTLKISGIFPGHFLVMLFGLKNVQSSRIPTLFENKIFMLDLAKHFSICQSFGIRNNYIGRVKREKISLFI